MPEESSSPVIGGARDRELLNRATYTLYKKTQDVSLGYYRFEPDSTKTFAGARPAIIFFHGGMYDQSLPAQFAPHCLHFANRGLVAYSVEYRVDASGSPDPQAALQDARDFMSYLLGNTGRYRIDPEKLILGGASSGGHLALHLSSRHKLAEELLAGLPKPVALVLFSPISNTTSKGITHEFYPDPKTAKRVSPSEQITKELPPMVLFHGKADTAIPFSQSEKFAKAWKRKNNDVTFLEFETARHIDFNFNVNPELYGLTLRAADQFLVEHGLLPPDPDAELY